MNYKGEPAEPELTVPKQASPDNSPTTVLPGRDAILTSFYENGPRD